MLFSLIILLNIFFCACKAGVTEIPSLQDEATIETVFDDSWMPSNIFEVKTSVHNDKKIETKPQENRNDIADAPESSWDTDSSPIFKAIRDFLFQATDEIINTKEDNEDPTEELVKIIEKGLIEATTIFLKPSEEQVSTVSTTTSEGHQSEISVVKIENVSPDSMLERIGLNAMNTANHQTSVINATTACSDCYNTLQTCVQMCFRNHNCNDVEREARVCPPPAARLCNIFTQWGPIDECRNHKDCDSPFLCCNDGCINKCSPGV